MTNGSVNLTRINFDGIYIEVDVDCLYESRNEITNGTGQLTRSGDYSQFFINLLKETNCLSVFQHFVELVFQGLKGVQSEVEN